MDHCDGIFLQKSTVPQKGLRARGVSTKVLARRKYWWGVSETFPNHKRAEVQATENMREKRPKDPPLLQGQEAVRLPLTSRGDLSLHYIG